MEEQKKYLTYQLQTKRVCGLNKDNTPKIEEILVKLGGSVLLEKYCKFLSVRGFIKTDPPKIKKVLEKSGKECGGNEIIEAQEVVDKLLNVSKTEAPIDYKIAFESQEVEIKDLQGRLKALESMQSKLDPKLGSDIGSKPKTKPGPKTKSKNIDSDQVFDILKEKVYPGAMNKEKRGSKPSSNE